MSDDGFTYWVELPAGTKHVVFEDLPHLIALALWPDAEAHSERRDFAYGGARLNLEEELPKAVDDGRLKVRDPLTLGAHTFPVGAALKRSLVLLPDLRDFLAHRGGGVGVRVASVGRDAQSETPTATTSYLYRLELPRGTMGLPVAEALKATARAVHPVIEDDARAEFQASIARILTMKDHASHLWLQVENDQILPRSPLTGRVPELAPQTYPDTVRDAWLLPLSELRKLCDSLGIEVVIGAAPAKTAIAPSPAGESTVGRCARLLRWLREEEAKQVRGALARVVARDGRARQTVSEDIAKARKAEGERADPLAAMARIVRR